MTFKAAEETNIPQGYDKVDNFPYQLPGTPRKFFIVIAYKTGEM